MEIDLGKKSVPMVLSLHFLGASFLEKQHMIGECSFEKKTSQYWISWEKNKNLVCPSEYFQRCQLVRAVSLSQTSYIKDYSATCGGSVVENRDLRNMETQIITTANHYFHVITTHVNETNPELNNEFFKELIWEMSSLNLFPLDEMSIFSCVGIVYSHNVLESIKLEHLKKCVVFFSGSF